MKSIGRKLIIISFILALLASAAVYSYLQTIKEDKKENENKVAVLVAADTLPPGTLITNEFIKEIEVSEDSLLVDYIQNVEEIVGKFTKDTILVNEGFHPKKLVTRGNEDLSLRLNDGHRAVSVNVTGDSGVSDLMKPGDFVDIVLYLDEERDGDKVIRPKLSKIILQKIKLLAIDKQLNREEGIGGAEVPDRFLVTLSVTAEELEKLVLAENVGILKLALRPLNNTGNEDTNGATTEQLIAEFGVSQVLATDKKIQDSVKGSSEDISEYSTYEDSSGKYIRYQIKRGDTLMKISQKFYGDPGKYKLIKDANKIADTNLILTGELIRIPVID